MSFVGLKREGKSLLGVAIRATTNSACGGDHINRCGRPVRVARLDTVVRNSFSDQGTGEVNIGQTDTRAAVQCNSESGSGIRIRVEYRIKNKNW